MKKTLAILMALLLGLVAIGCDNGAGDDGAPVNSDPPLTEEAAQLQGIWRDSTLKIISDGKNIGVGSNQPMDQYVFSGYNFTYFCWNFNADGTYITGTFQADGNEILLITSSAARKLAFQFDSAGRLVLDGSDKTGDQRIQGGTYNGSSPNVPDDFGGTWSNNNYSHEYIYHFSEDSFEFIADGETEVTGTFRIDDNVITFTGSDQAVTKSVYTFFDRDTLVFDHFSGPGPVGGGVYKR